MFLEEIVVLELGPHEVCLLLLLYYLPPEPAPDEFLDERTVVAPAHPSLQSSLTTDGLLLRLLHVKVVAVAPVHPEEKLTVGRDSSLVDGVRVLGIDWPH